MKLSPKQKRFCDEYLVDPNGAAAARKAGYSEKSAKRIAIRVMELPQVKKYLQERELARQIRTEISQDLVVTKVLNTIAKAEAEHSPNWAQVVLKGTDQLFQILGSYKQKHEHGGPNGGPIPIAASTVTPEQLAEAIRSVRNDY
jgi:phage terminase small subunit